MTARAPLAFRVPGRPAAARPDAAPAPARRERLGARGHDLARIPVRPPPAGSTPAAAQPASPASGAAPIQAAGLFEAYQGLKGRAGRAYDAAGAAYGRAKGAVTSSRAYRAAAGAYGSLSAGAGRLAGRVRSTGLYRGAAAVAGDVRAIGKDLDKSERFQKVRAVAGVLGLAGGHRQGYVEHGAEARGAFRGRWEKYFESLPPEKRARAMARYTLPEQEAGDGGDSGGGGPEEIEMQEFPPRGGGGVGGGGGGGGCAAEGGQVAHPRNRFDDSASSGGPCPGGGARYPQNRFSD
jgi:hypothetical protein